MESRQFIASLAAADSSEQLEVLRADAIAEENRFRELFAQSREDWDVPELDDPYQSLVPVFATLEAQPDCFKNRDAPQLPLVFKQEVPEWRKDMPAVVDRATFQHHFDLFTEGMLRGLNWDNVFCAGGCIGACLTPIPPKHNSRSRDRRSYFHDQAFPGSDVDLFLWGLSEEEANKKVVEIYNTVADNCLFDVLCFRSAYAISIVSQYPFRHVQIVLRLYSSPFEVLAGFDVDSCSIGFNGKDVLMTPRAHLATVTRTNTIDMTRRSPTYELRLQKYSKRGLQVAVPGLIRERIDPMIYERDFSKLFGLKRLLVLEKLGTAESRAWYKEMVRVKRGRQVTKAFRRRDHWMNARLTDLPGGGVEASDYSTVFLPWGPEWNAFKCRQLMQQKDRMLNNEYANGFRGYPLHPCFIGDAQQVLQDCFPHDGSLPAHADPELVKHHVRGPVSWIKDNPGRQMIGSFNPITEGDWMEGAMLSEFISDLIAAACTGDAAKLAAFLATQPDIDINLRDKFGRTALLVSALVGSTDCVQLCLDRGATVTQKLPDGRNALHIAAAYGWEGVAQLVISAAGDELHTMVNAVDERSMTPLYWAIALGQLRMAALVVSVGARANASPKLSTTSTFNQSMAATEVKDEHIHPFLFAMHLPAMSMELARDAVRLLVKAGAKSTDLTQAAATILHQVACANGYEYMDAFLTILFEEDPTYETYGEVLMNTLDDQSRTPLSVALTSGNYSAAQAFVTRGASMLITQEMLDRATRMQSAKILSGETTNRRRMNRPRNPWYFFFQKFVQLISNPREIERGVLPQAVAFLRFVLERESDPNPTLSSDDLPLLTLGESKKATLAEALNLYTSHLPSVESHNTQLDDSLTQLQALKRLMNESNLALTYQSYYQYQAARVAMHVTLANVANLDRQKKQSNSTEGAQNEGAEAFRALAQEMSAKYPSWTVFPGQRSGRARNFHRQQVDGELGGKHVNEVTQELRKRTQAQAEAQMRYITPDVKHFQANVYHRCSAIPSDTQSKYTALFEAAYLGDTDRVRQLCERSTSATPELLMCVCNPMGETPFSIALLRGHVDTAAAVFQTAMQQYESFRSTQESLKLAAAKDLQSQLTNEAVESGLSTTHRLLAKVDNFALAGMQAAMDESDGEGSGAAPLVATSRTVRSVQQALDLSTSEGNSPAQTPPDVLLRIKAILPAIERPSSMAFRSDEDVWLHNFDELLRNSDHTFDRYTVHDMLKLVESAPKDGSGRSLQVAPHLTPVGISIWQRRSDITLRILEWSKELVRHDMARAHPQDDSPYAEPNPVELLYSKHDELAFAAELFKCSSILPSILLTDNVELFEALVRETGLMYPFQSMPPLLGIGVAGPGDSPVDQAFQNLHLDTLKAHVADLYPLAGATDPLPNAFEISIFTSTGSQHALQASCEQTIRHLKASIQGHHGYQAIHQRLFLDGVQLEDDRTVSSYPAIQPGSRLDLVMRHSDLSPAGTLPGGAPSLPSLLHGSVMHGADKILACVVSGRATALLDEYLDTSSPAKNFHTRLALKARELIFAFLADDVLRKPLSALYDNAVTRLVIDFDERHNVTQRKLGELLFEDWFFAFNNLALSGNISSMDLQALKKMRAAMSDETWLALLNDQQESAFLSLVAAASASRSSEQRTAPLLEVISWLFENGMQVLPPMVLKLGQLPLHSHISTAHSLISEIIAAGKTAKHAVAADDPAQQVLGCRATDLDQLFSGMKQEVFEALLERIPPAVMQQFVSLFTLYKDGCHPVHLLACLDQKFSGNLEYWLRADVMANVDPISLANAQGITTLHHAVSKPHVAAVRILLGKTAEAAAAEALPVLSSGIVAAPLHGAVANIEDAHGNTPFDNAAGAYANQVTTAAQALHNLSGMGKPTFRGDAGLETYLQCLTSLQLSSRVLSTAEHVVEQQPSANAGRAPKRRAGMASVGAKFYLPHDQSVNNPPCVLHASTKNHHHGLGFGSPQFQRLF